MLIGSVRFIVVGRMSYGFVCRWSLVVRWLSVSVGVVCRWSFVEEEEVCLLI